MTARELEVRLQLGAGEGRLVGTLVEEGRRVWFAWDRAYDGPEISPYALPARPGSLVEHPRSPGRALPGVFDDARPDGWGLKLLHRAFQQRGRPARSVSALEELAFLGERTMGALTFHPPSHADAQVADAVELGALARHARQVYADEVTEVLPELVRAGGSPGGARPKALVGLRADDAPGVVLGEGRLGPDWRAWMVKFRAPHEDLEVARREQAWMRMAAAAGITVPETRVLDLGDGEEAFGVRRFDRTDDGRRLHMLSAAGALDVDFRAALVDASELLRLTSFVCSGDLRQVVATYRRIVFNVASVNEDDHLKNLAFLLDASGTWSLSPGYDLTWSPHPAGYRSTPVMDESQCVERAHLLELAEVAGLPSRTAHGVLEQVLDATGAVGDFLDEVGCTGAVSVEARTSVHSATARLSPS